MINLTNAAIKKGISIKLFDPIANNNFIEKNIFDNVIKEFLENEKFDAIFTSYHIKCF